jgi:hypothetical protein
MACEAMNGWIMWYLTWRHAIRAGAILSGAAAAACLCLLCRLRPVRSMVRLIIRQVVVVFVVVVRSIIIIRDVRREVADGGVSDFHITL